MGSYGGGDRRIFTGLDPAQPVELFISLIEQEGSVMDHDPGWRCEEALRRIDRGNTPAGIWYSSGAGAKANSIISSSCVPWRGLFSLLFHLVLLLKFFQFSSHTLLLETLKKQRHRQVSLKIGESTKVIVTPPQIFV